MARNTNSTGFSLKNELFNPKKVHWLATQFKTADPTFKAAAFEKDVCAQLGELELKARITHIANVLARYLDSDFSVAAKQILAALPPALDTTKQDNDFGDFILAPLGTFVVENGCTKKHLKRSLSLLKELTKRFSMEFAIRPFINAFPEETLTALATWSCDKNYHVRRLVSEGTRPRLPWSARLTIDYRAPLPFLDTLHADKTRYVTRSVANHLNDISKVDPALVVSTLQRCHKQSQQEDAELNWITRHALRSLIKQGYAPALALVGLEANPPVVVHSFSLATHHVALGEAVEFTATVEAHAETTILIDYVIEFVKKNGQRTAKVFKGSTIALQAGEVTTFTKRHVLKVQSSTYTYYPGVHLIALQIQGVRHDAIEWTLVM